MHLFPDAPSDSRNASCVSFSHFAESSPYEGGEHSPSIGLTLTSELSRARELPPGPGSV